MGPPFATRCSSKSVTSVFVRNPAFQDITKHGLAGAIPPVRSAKMVKILDRRFTSEEPPGLPTELEYRIEWHETDGRGKTGWIRWADIANNFDEEELQSVKNFDTEYRKNLEGRLKVDCPPLTRLKLGFIKRIIRDPRPKDPQKKNIFLVEVYMENSFGLSSIFIVTSTFLRQDLEHRRALCRFYEDRIDESEGKLIRSIPLEEADVEKFLAHELALPELDRTRGDDQKSSFVGFDRESPPSKRLKSDGAEFL